MRNRAKIVIAILVAVTLAACQKREEPDSNPTQPPLQRDVKLSPAWTRSNAPAPQSPPALTTHTLVPPHAARIVDTPIDADWKPILVRSADGNSRTQSALGTLPAVDEAAAARTARWWSAGAVFRWNEIARTLTARRRLGSSHSSRLFAALAVAQHDAALLSREQSKHSGGIDPTRVSAIANGLVERRNSVSQEAAIAYASAIVLEDFFGKDAVFLRQNAWAHTASRCGSAPIAMPRSIPADLSVHTWRRQCSRTCARMDRIPQMNRLLPSSPGDGSPLFRYFPAGRESLPGSWIAVISSERRLRPRLIRPTSRSHSRRSVHSRHTARLSSMPLPGSGTSA